MVRKIILQMLISVVMILTLTSAFVVTIVYINKGKSEKKDKLYEINATHGCLIQTIAHYLVKPILESALDRYIEKHGLTEYLEEITQQKEEDSINFYEITEGNGSKAFCGLEVLLQIYKISNNNLATLPSKVSDVTLKIGQGDLKEVGLGVIGMKEGGERVVTIANDNKNSYYVKLIEVKDKYPDSVNNLMIFNDLINKTGKQVKCGDEISVQYSIKRHNGEYIIKDQAVQFKVGDRKAPLVIEFGVVGMRAGNKRTILSPPGLLTDMLIKDIDFDEENISIIDLSLDAKQEVAAHYSTVEK
ncbi:MAG: FKBP-type peptidyl-prolyl cis-trans isomerase [Wolbachia sp.]